MKKSEKILVLPAFIRPENKIQMAFLCAAIFFVGYSIPNHFHYFPPQLLPLTDFDKSMPFIPSTVFIYISEYLLFITAYFAFNHEINRNRYVWSYLGVLFFGMLVFLLYPTTYPRADFPVPLDVHPLTALTFRILRTMDDPSNCFPSMHVTCCYVTAFSFLPSNESRKKFWVYFIWSTLVGASTLPTKQHYAVDVLAGIVLAVSGSWFFFRKVSYVSTAEFIERVRSTSRRKRRA